jgi:hypothetical protein
MKIYHLLKREVGENPTLSRNCIWEFVDVDHCLTLSNGKVSANDDHKPGDLPRNKASINHADGEVLCRGQ